MRIVSIPLLISAVFVFMVSCNPRKTQPQDFRVIVSILPQKFLVDKISGGNLPCEVMVPPGGNHETFEPSPRDMARVADASVYYTIGALDFEKAWIEKVKAVNPEIEIVNTSKGIQMIEGHSHDDTHNHSQDPHTWLSPAEVKIQAGSICESLCRMSPEDSVTFRRNLRLFTNEADSATVVIKRLLSSHCGNTFIIYHPALAYFAREFGLKQESIEFEGKEPSPVHMREIIDIAQANGIKAILVSREFDTRHAQTIASQIGGELMTFDPMAYDWTTNIIGIASLIAGSLSQQSGETRPAK